MMERSSRSTIAQNEPKQPAVDMVVKSVKNRVNHKEKPIDYYLEMVEKFTAELYNWIQFFIRLRSSAADPDGYPTEGIPPRVNFFD